MKQNPATDDTIRGSRVARRLSYCSPPSADLQTSSHVQSTAKHTPGRERCVECRRAQLSAWRRRSASVGWLDVKPQFIASPSPSLHVGGMGRTAGRGGGAAAGGGLMRRVARATVADDIHHRVCRQVSSQATARQHHRPPHSWWRRQPRAQGSHALRTTEGREGRCVHVVASSDYTCWKEGGE